MHPLLMTFSPHAYTPWGWNNLQSWINGGASHIMYTPMGRVYRLLTRIAVETLFHPLQPFIFGLKNMAPKAAITYKLPLVFIANVKSRRPLITLVQSVKEPI